MPLCSSCRIGRQYTQFSPLDVASFGVNIYDSGRVLSIVTDAGAHGTHVAGIVAAYHPEVRCQSGGVRTTRFSCA